VAVVGKTAPLFGSYARIARSSTVSLRGRMGLLLAPID